MAVDGDRPQSGGEVEGQRCPGGHVGDAGVRHHRSVAVRIAAAPSFPFEVQGQGPPAPGLFDLSLHLGRKFCGFNFVEFKNKSKKEGDGGWKLLPRRYKSSI